MSRKVASALLFLALMGVWAAAVLSSRGTPARASSDVTPVTVGTRAIGRAKPGVLRPGMRLTAPSRYRHQRIVAYQWMRCGRKGRACGRIRGAVHRSYTVRLADVGHALRAMVATQAQTVAMTSPTGPVGRPAPVNTALPVISDGGQGGGSVAAPIVGDVLSGSNGTWQHAVAYTYQWDHCDATGANCAAIAGATANAYTLQDSDAGFTIVFVVTAYNYQP